MNPDPNPTQQSAEARTPAERAALLERFRGPVEARDAEVIEHWRHASPAEHAAAMIDLADMAERIVASTGFGKAFDEQFPGFPRPAGNPGGGRSPAA